MATSESRRCFLGACLAAGAGLAWGRKLLADVTKVMFGSASDGAQTAGTAS